MALKLLHTILQNFLYDVRFFFMKLRQFKISNVRILSACTFVEKLNGHHPVTRWQWRHPCVSMSPIFRFESIFFFFLFLSISIVSFLSVWSATEGRRNRVNLLLHATLIWIRLCIVCYRKEHTLWSQRHFHIERQPARKSPYNGVVVLPATMVYRNLRISAIATFAHNAVFPCVTCIYLKVMLRGKWNNLAVVVCTRAVSKFLYKLWFIIIRHIVQSACCQ